MPIKKIIERIFQYLEFTLSKQLKVCTFHAHKLFEVTLKTWGLLVLRHKKSSDYLSDLSYRISLTKQKCNNYAYLRYLNYKTNVYVIFTRFV